ncbi:metallophosphoesterase [Leptotrichia trevisanii]|uniref:metallophosphoesterase family protein n=1 Tax=Leptotrichia trevisanii TaxID=109328 RepID=UPI0026F05DF7|nr:metallophosphoesterase family protein [Leptotrichia trevisanii]
MKIAILSDIHGNLEGLKKVLKIISKNKVDKIICLGDIFGYGIDSKDCYEILTKLGCNFIMGNHDAMYCDIIDSNSCSNNGKISTIWQKENIKVNLDDIKKFENNIRIDNLLFLHSCLGEYGYLKYLNKLEDILSEYENEKIVFYGHTHRPRITLLRNGEVQDTFIKKTTVFSIEKDDKVFVNVGSVGQQRDNQTDSSFVVLDINENNIKFELYRVKYNSLKTYLKINQYPELKSIATYLIRENLRRKVYEFINYWWNRIHRQKVSATIKKKE